MMDPSLYKDPHVFNPDRFFERCSDPEASRKSGYTEFDPESKVFGFGGRLVMLSIFSEDSSILTCLSAFVPADFMLMQAFGWR